MNNEIVIEVKDLCKCYDRKMVVDHVSLTVKRGEIYGFLGPNGSGKTTTIRMICGLSAPSSGEGRCLGYDIKTEALQIKSKIGYMTQHFSLYRDLSVVENLDFIGRLFGVANLKVKISEIVEKFKFSHHQQHQLAKNLSGGWKQRLALAAAVLHEPEVLLLDEPTAGVDPKARRDFWDEIHQLSSQGVTTLVSTHYMDEAERCHRLAYIAYGKLLVTGDRNQVIDHANLNTWRISGDNLAELADKLYQQVDKVQINVFGQHLHVSLSNDLDDRQLLSYQYPPYKWQKIPSSLEDVFIYLMQQSKGGV